MLLSAALIADPSLLEAQLGETTLLELGCGCGLVGIVALQLLLKSYKSVNSHPDKNQSHVLHASMPSLHLSDNDQEVLDLLLESITSQSVFTAIPSLTSSANLHITHLNWLDYLDDENMSKRMTKSRFSLILGSALVYAPEHAALADVLSHFLNGACEKALILQICDRPGFSEFLARLDVLSMPPPPYFTSLHLLKPRFICVLQYRDI